MKGARPLAVLSIAAAVLLAACQSRTPPDAAGDGRLQIVTTVAPITSIVASVVGDNADITGVVPEGTNSHTFEPAPSVAVVLARADVVFLNGLMLEEPTLELAEANVDEGTPIVELGDEVLPRSEWIFDFSFPEEEGKPNPHLWTDPTYAQRYAEVVRDTMVGLDPDNAASYQANYEAFATDVAELDQAMRAAFETVPAKHRKLLTYHDAYAYFAETYGWEVIGAIQVESFEEPAPQEVAGLIEQVKRHDVPAIFGSEVFPSPVLERIGREAGVRYVDVLRDDDLPGEPGESEHSWLGLMRFNYITIVEAMGGDAQALESVDLASDVPDEAHYPQ